MKHERKRVVLDTNTIVSGVIRPLYVPAEALRKALLECDVFVSRETFGELQNVLTRNKFDRYFADPLLNRAQFLDHYGKKAIECEVSGVVTDCRDPKDNKFLALALAAQADFIVTGDARDLLNMNPYRGVHIVTAKAFLTVIR